MKKIVLLCGALLTLTAVAANAQLNLAVGDCAGAPAATWTCTASTGTALTAVASVFAPAVTVVTGEEATLEVAFNVPVPEWWKSGTGLCRALSAINVAYAPAAASCYDYFGQVGPSGGFFTTIGPGTDAQGPVDANRLRIRTVSAINGDLAADPATIQPAPGDDMYLFSLVVNKTKTTGTGSCAGCSTPGCIVFKKLIITQPVGMGDFFYQTPQNYGFITIQGGTPDCPQATPASKSSWGQVKSLYR